MFHSDSIPASSSGNRVPSHSMSVARKHNRQQQQQNDKEQRQSSGQQRSNAASTSFTHKVHELIKEAIIIATGLQVDITLLNIPAKDFHARIPETSSIPLRVARDGKQDVATQLRVIFETLEMPLQVVPEPTQELVIEVEELADLVKISQGFEAALLGTDVVFRGWAMVHMPEAPTRSVRNEVNHEARIMSSDDIRVTDTSGLAQLFVDAEDSDQQSLFAIANNLDRRL